MKKYYPFLLADLLVASFLKDNITLFGTFNSILNVLAKYYVTGGLNEFMTPKYYTSQVLYTPLREY